MFMKILAVSALSLGMATSVMAQSATGGATGTGGAAGTGTTNGSGAMGTQTPNASSNQNGAAGVDSGTTGSTTTGSQNDGKSQDCNGMNSSKNTMSMKQDQMNNPAGSSNCQ